MQSSKTAGSRRLGTKRVRSRNRILANAGRSLRNQNSRKCRAVLSPDSALCTYIDRQASTRDRPRGADRRHRRGAGVPTAGSNRQNRPLRPAGVFPPLRSVENGNSEGLLRNQLVPQSHRRRMRYALAPPPRTQAQRRRSRFRETRIAVAIARQSDLAARPHGRSPRGLGVAEDGREVRRIALGRLPCMLGSEPSGRRHEAGRLILVRARNGQELGRLIDYPLKIAAD